MAAIILPSLVAGRENAAGAVRQLGDLAGQRVVIDARLLESGSPSFAAQLVRSAIVDGEATTFVLVGGPTEFVTAIKQAGEDLDVSGRISFSIDDDELR